MAAALDGGASVGAKPVPKSPMTYRITPLLGPEHHLTEMERTVADRHYEARQQEREQAKVASRAAQRLEVARGRHRRALDQLEAETALRTDGLQRHIALKEVQIMRQQEATHAHLDSARAATESHQEQEALHIAATAAASAAHADARAEVDRSHAQTTRELREASARADSAIEASRADTRAKLEALRQHRADLERKMVDAVATRAQGSRALVEDLRVQTIQRVLKAEAYRHTSAMTCERIGEAAQGARTAAQEKALLNEAKAAQQAAEMAQQCHKAQVQTDTAVRKHLQGSALELQAARDYCAQVRENMAKEAAAYAQRVRQLEDEQRARDAEAESRRGALEEKRVEGFCAGMQAVQEAEDRFRARREACEAELDMVEARLRQVEEETRQREEQILAAWTAGSAAAEETVRGLERQAEDALREMREATTEGGRANASEKEALQQSGTDTVCDLERQANQVLDATQPTLEATRREDELATAAAAEAFRLERPQPSLIERTADAQVEEAMRWAEEQERAAEAEAEARGSAARARSKAAQEEEKWLKQETAEAWARLRRACYQLRLINLHDFAQGIVDGQFDLRPKEQLTFAVGIGLPVLKVAS